MLALKGHAGKYFSGPLAATIMARIRLLLSYLFWFNK